MNVQCLCFMLEHIAMGCLNQPEWKHEVITTKSNYILFICDVLLLPGSSLFWFM